jgi:F-type H+-transporting ATPase subunit alpha
LGQKESTVAGLVEVLRQHGAMDYTIVVSAGAADPAPLQYIAPYAGCAMAEYFMYEHGGHTLCIYDDLSKQAQAYRQLSLLLRRPPGREAYPGRRVLPAQPPARAVLQAGRAACHREEGRPGRRRRRASTARSTRACRTETLEEDLKELGDSHETRKLKKSGGSLTALPVIETLEGEVSAYIPTNVISITDGQIYLEPDLFFAGVRPAINVGISVSASVVTRRSRDEEDRRLAASGPGGLPRAGGVRPARHGTRPGDAGQLDRGRRMVELLKQPQYEPMDVWDQVLAIHAGSRGYLDDIPIEDVSEFEKELLKYYEDEKKAVRDELISVGKMTDELDQKLKDATQAFKDRFVSSRNQG